jgi:hypothetical protein
MTTDDPDAFEQVNLEFNSVRPGFVDDAAFKLSAYGLPDLPIPSTSRSGFFSPRNPVFWLCMVVAIAAFGLLFSRSRDRA